jgi:hypothetical protein
LGIVSNNNGEGGGVMELSKIEVKLRKKLKLIVG